MRSKMPADVTHVDGLLLIDKPSGPTSHDIVSEVRRILGGVKAGHTGTLDPLASGLLVVLIGKATKLAPFVQGDPKIYEGTMVLGITTDTMDTDGTVTSEGPCQAEAHQIPELLVSLSGVMEQIPPAYSAVKFKGKPSYRYARRGEEVPRPPRKVTVYRSEMTDFRKLRKRVEVDFIISCSPGFYVREYASRVGDSLGCGGALSSLRRLASGPFHLDRALTLEGLQAAWEGTSSPISPPLAALEGLNRIKVAVEGLPQARNGASLEQPMIEEFDGESREGDLVAVIDPDGELLGVHEVARDYPLKSKPRRML